MAVGSFMKSGGLTALAAVLAVLALPASVQAQERSQGRWGGGGRGGAEASAQSGGGNSWRGNSGSRGARSGQATRAQQPQAQPQRQRNWSGSTASRPNRGEDRAASWRGRSDRANRVQAPVRAIPQAPAQTQTERRSWGNRNNSDRDYSSAYRNSARSRDDSARARANNNPWRNQPSGIYRGNDRDDRRDNWSRNDRSRNDWNRNNWNNNNNWRGNRSGYAQRWDRNWRRDNRYDWRGYRSANRGVYRLNPYYAPYRNYSYRRLSSGFYLDSLFFGSRYLINDPWQYRLPPADGPFRWVRYYDDALLVDIYSGEVIDVIYDFFW